MILIYLSAKTIAENHTYNKVVVRADIFHNNNNFTETHFFQYISEQKSKMTTLNLILKNIPWTNESVTVLLNDDDLYKRYKNLNQNDTEWNNVLKWQRRFSLVISFRNKGVISGLLEEKFISDLKKTLYLLQKNYISEE